jgi:F-type H+-transporting ATPase subunit b
MKKAFVVMLCALSFPLIASASEGSENILKPDLGLAIWTAITFIVMVVILAKLAFNPIAEALDRRSQTIKKSLDDAEKSRAEAKSLMESYQKQIAEARTEANKLMEEARVLGEKVRREVVDKANTDASAVVQRAQEEIERQKEKGVQELKDTVANLSVQIASRVLEKEVDEATHRQLVEDIIRDLGKMHKK